MNSWPIIMRELLLQSRHPMTNRARWVAVMIVLVIAALMMMSGGYAQPQQRAKLIFIFIGIVALGAAMLAGVFQTSDSLSEERREGTLGLLFLTDLRGYDVVFGKLVSTSLLSLYTFLAIVPVLALPLLMGGTTLGEFWRIVLVLLTTLYLSLSLGMFVSALSRDGRKAMAATFIAMVCLAGVLPLFWSLSLSRSFPSGVAFIRYPAPPFAFQQAFDNYYSSWVGVAYFWRSIVTMATIATGCLAAACWLAGRIWQETGERERVRRTRYLGWFLDHSKRTQAAHELRSRNPFFWLASRDTRIARIFYGLFALMLPVWSFLYYRLYANDLSGGSRFFPMLLLMTFGLHVVFKCLVTVEATRRFSEDRQSGALELLLATPLSIGEIVSGQVRAVWKLFGVGFIMLTVLNMAMIRYFIGSNVFGRDADGLIVFLVMLTGGIVVLWMDGYALVRVGMWHALTKPKQSRAFLATLMQILLPPWLAILGMIFLAAVGAVAGGGANSASGILIFWFIVGALTDLVMTSRVMPRLENDFREIAAVGLKEPISNRLA